MIRLSAEPHSDPSISAEAVAINVVVESLGAELSRRNSRLATDGLLDADFERQTRAILREAFSQLQHLSPELPHLVTVEYGSAASMVETAHIRAAQDIHPAEPLMAAEALFGVALPIVRDVIVQRTPDADLVVVARTLHHAVWRRFPPGAISYVEVLRARLSTAHQESRRRVSLELHDRVAHGIAAGIQRIELSTLNGGADPSTELVEALSIFRAALDDVQDLALELRQRVGDRSLDQALAEYIVNAGDVPPPVRLKVDGTNLPLSASVAEEAFTIVLEALRNARTHAVGASGIDVHVRWEERMLSIDVTDDGPGFDPTNVHTRAIGLSGMEERARAIGARLQISASSGGTTVSLSLPLEPTVLA
ncbi:sensor histidine kinase [Leifsonia flava]|uniref:Sensor histidine kinase n=1 Tax=Orlajensenia leifsoniae TaxID=2561933 RepID=A0A4Y9R6Y8_9MICO|nr:ATP-binding protein [Leifsonia flava]TFV99898.1 sensor histidine kinase [Leifsonia flava]